MAQTRPRLEQIVFKSAKTGAHNIDTYLEAAEFGNRTLAQLMGDLFDANGNFAPEDIVPEFRISQSGGQIQLQYRTDSSASFTDLIGFFNDRGAFSTSTAYDALDLVTTTSGSATTLYLVKTDQQTPFASQADFIASSSTQQLLESPAGVLADVQSARDDVLQDAGFIAVSTDLQATPSNIETVSNSLGTGQAVTVVGDDLALGASSNITKVATDIANVNLVGPNISAVTTVANDLNATPSNIANFVGGLDATIDDLTIQGVAKGAIDSASTTTFDMSTANNYVFDRANGATLTLSNSHLCANMQPFTIVIKEDGTNTSLTIQPTGQFKWQDGSMPTLSGVSGSRLVISGFVLDPDPNNSTSAEIIAGFVSVSTP